MPSVIQLKSGKTETVFDLEDLLRLVEQHMGDDTRRLLEELTAPEDDAAEYIADLEKENQRLRDHHHEVMTELRSFFSPSTRTVLSCFVTGISSFPVVLDHLRPEPGCFYNRTSKNYFLMFFPRSDRSHLRPKVVRIYK